MLGEELLSEKIPHSEFTACSDCGFLFDLVLLVPWEPGLVRLFFPLCRLSVFLCFLAF